MVNIDHHIIIFLHEHPGGINKKRMLLLAHFYVQLIIAVFTIAVIYFLIRVLSDYHHELENLPPKSLLLDKETIFERINVEFQDELRVRKSKIQSTLSLDLRHNIDHHFNTFRSTHMRDLNSAINGCVVIENDWDNYDEIFDLHTGSIKLDYRDENYDYRINLYLKNDLGSNNLI